MIIVLLCYRHGSLKTIIEISVDILQRAWSCYYIDVLLRFRIEQINGRHLLNDAR